MYQWNFEKGLFTNKVLACYFIVTIVTVVAIMSFVESKKNPEFPFSEGRYKAQLLEGETALYFTKKMLRKLSKNRSADPHHLPLEFTNVLPMV